MSTQTDILAEIDSFIQARKMPETTFGFLVMNDNSFVSRLRGGRNISVNTADRVREYIAAELAGSPPA